MTVTIDGRVYDCPIVEEQDSGQRATIRVFAKDPDNPQWLLDVQAYAEGVLVDVLAECEHGSLVTVTGTLTRTSSLPETDEAGNTSGRLAMTAVELR